MTRGLLAVGLSAAIGLGCPRASSSEEASAVERTRAAIVAAAEARDWASLDALARTPGFMYTLGPEEASPSAYWQREGTAALDRLVVLLHSTPLVQADSVVVWPRWAVVPASDRTSRDRREMAASLADTTGWFLPDGSYVGETVAIDASGRWLSFVGGE